MEILDWPPAPEPLALPTDQVHVWRIRLDLPPVQVEALLAQLSEEEQARASRFRRAADRRQMIISHSALRAILSRYTGLPPASLRFNSNPYVKPFLLDNSEGLQFNLAHSGDLALAAVAQNRRVGVDIEKIRPLDDIERLARRFFAPGETARLLALPEAERLEAFFTTWTCKEAFLKALGTGLSTPLDSFEVITTPAGAPRLEQVKSDNFKIEQWKMRSLLPKVGYVGAVVEEAK